MSPEVETMGDALEEAVMNTRKIAKSAERIAFNPQKNTLF